MQVTAMHIQENEDTLNQIAEWRDIDKAQGKVLEQIGSNVRQSRGALGDDTYRIMIKSKIKRSLSDGSIDTLIDFISFILQIEPKNVNITEFSSGSGTLHVDVPAGAINSTGLSLAQFGQLINLVTVAGVRADVLFQGTFSFSSNYSASETDANAGFDGGTLGYAYTPGQDTSLPI